MGKLRKFATQLRLWCLDDWEAKLVALVLASIVWYVVKDKVARDKKVTLPEGWSTRTSTGR
ncbi:MAG: hypothetical protein WCN98_13090 [Verrucomicrobiaceae bacterium]